ncbi:MAG: tetratricopeptide repeat protein [Candidatus Solibacter sp.]|nr:tetratricopeptide repeat protein [Candidatus Solibacter sp.]
MKPRYLPAFLAAVAAFSVSCVHQTQVSRSAPARVPMSNWDRQVRNAIDAGDGDYQLRVLREKVAAEPDNIPVRLELAKAYRERGYHEVSLEISRLAVARFPESGDAQLALASDLRGLDRRPEAIAGLESFLRAHPESGAAHYSWLGILRDESGLWPLGEPAHRKALELNPAADYLHNNLGYNLLMQKKNEEAAREFQAALKLNPGSLMARNNLGLALAHSNDTAQAVANWQATSDPATAHNNLAAVWIEEGNYPEARRELDLALSYNRAHPAATRNLELVARLDGSPATLQSKQLDSRLRRFTVAVRKLFVGPLNDSRTEAAKSASAH